MSTLPGDYQSIYADSSLIFATIGQSIDLSIYYNASEANLSGLSVNVHFNSTLLDLQNYKSIISGVAISEIVLLSDSDDLDGDPLTDQFIQFIWATFDNTFPGIQVPGEVAEVVFSGKHTLADNDRPKTTSIRFSASETASGYEFLGEDKDVYLNYGNGTPASITSSSAGVFREGVTLTAPVVTGDPDGDALNPNYSHQWFKGSTAITGATASTYAVPVTGGGIYKVAVTYTDAQNFRVTVDSPEQVVSTFNNGNGTAGAIKGNGVLREGVTLTAPVVTGDPDGMH
jgi:hypothetical protein